MCNAISRDVLPYRTNREVEELVRSFESGTLSYSEWTHIAHLTVAMWYLIKYSTNTATQLITDGIRRFNAMNGIEATRTSGYHETMTIFWIWAISTYLATARAENLANLANGLVKTLGDKRLPFEYYSRERLMSWEARSGWVDPDLKPLDWQPGVSCLFRRNST